MYRYLTFRRSATILLMTSLLLLAACGSDQTIELNPPAAGTATLAPLPTLPPALTPTGSASSPTGATGLSLYTEPDAGTGPIITAIQNARTSIWVEMYLLTNTTIIQALEDAAGRHIDVRVMLEQSPVGGSGSITPTETVTRLNAAGVQAKFTNPAFTLTHAKLLIADGTIALISTGNYTLSALGGSSQAVNREFIVRDTDAADVGELQQIYAADWNRQTPNLSNPHLVVSPVNARARILAVINGAQKTLHLEQEEMQDTDVINSLIAAEQRGVIVQVVVPTPKAGSNDYIGEQQLIQAQVAVIQVQSSGKSTLYIHAKDIIADGTLAYVGSVNMSRPSMDSNREIGILVGDPLAITTLESTFAHDFTTQGSNT